MSVNQKFCYEGLTQEETLCVQHLMSAIDIFKSIRPDFYDLKDFINAVHVCERIIGMRCLSRAYPNTWRKDLVQEEYLNG